MKGNDVFLEELKNAVLDFDADKTVEIAKKALENGVDPIKAIEEGIGKALEIVGKKFEEGEFFIVHLAAAGEAANKAINEVLRPVIEKRGEKTPFLGRVVIGTVAGDIHEIGKTIVGAMLMANGFEVIDLGASVPVETFVSKAKELHPDIIGMSALLSTTVPVQRDVIRALKKEEIREKVKVMVGGAPVTEEWAREIGADAYGSDAVDAVTKAKALLKRD